MSQFSKSEWISHAELCLNNGLYNGVFSYIKKLTQIRPQLSFDERQLIFASYYDLRRPLFSSFTFCEDTSKYGNIQRKLQRQAKKAISRLCDKTI